MVGKKTIQTQKEKKNVLIQKRDLRKNGVGCENLYPYWITN